MIGTAIETLTGSTAIESEVRKEQGMRFKCYNASLPCPRTGDVFRDGSSAEVANVLYLVRTNIAGRRPRSSRVLTVAVNTVVGFSQMCTRRVYLGERAGRYEQVEGRQLL